MDVGAGPALERPSGETPDIGANIQDYGSRGPIRDLIFPAQNLLNVAAPGQSMFV